MQHPEPIERYESRLATQGRRLTTKKRRLATHILAQECQFTAEDLSESFYRSYSAEREVISRPSINRTLSEFVSFGLIRVASNDRGIISLAPVKR